MVLKRLSVLPCSYFGSTDTLSTALQFGNEPAHKERLVEYGEFLANRVLAIQETLFTSGDLGERVGLLALRWEGRRFARKTGSPDDTIAWAVADNP